MSSRSGGSKRRRHFLPREWRQRAQRQPGGGSRYAQRAAGRRPSKACEKCGSPARLRREELPNLVAVYWACPQGHLERVT